MTEFTEFNKIARLSRMMTLTEKYADRQDKMEQCRIIGKTG